MSGAITRKEIIEDEALNFGNEYAKNVKFAIDANNELIGTIKELNAVSKQYRKAENQNDFITAKQAETLATKQAIDAIKKQEVAEISAEKIARQRLATLEAERKAKLSAADAELKSAKGKEKTVKLTLDERVQNEANNRILKQEALERLGLVSVYTKLNKSRTDAKNTLRDLIASESASTNEIKKAQIEFDKLDKKVKKADLAVSDFSKNVGNYPFQTAASGVKNLIGAFGVTGGIVAFAGIMKSAYETTKQFEQGIADLRAITGASGKDLDFLKNKAIELGKETKGGAIKVVEAYKLIASAKPELLENVKDLNAVTEAVLTLSKASGLDLPDAATRLTDAMNQFNAPASEAGKFIDALANGAKYGAAEIPDITDALLKFGAVARSTNVSVAESTALIELLAENGLKGAEAGTALRNVLLKLSAPDALPKNAQEALKELGISFDLLKDKSIPIQQRFEALKPLLSDNGKLIKVFGVENVVAAQNVISHTERLKDLTSKMDEYGTAQMQADIQTDTLQGDTDKLGSTFDSLVLSIGNGSGVVTDFFRFFVKGAKDALGLLIRLNSDWDELFGKAADAGAANGIKLYGEMLDSLKNTGTELEVSLSIAKLASRKAQILQEQLAENRKATLDPSSVPFFERLTEVGLKRQKETLLKGLAEQNAIIKENNKKFAAARNANKNTGTEPNAIIPGVTPDNSKEEKRATEKNAKDKLDREKKLSDSIFELKKQRLEQSIQINNEIVNDDQITDEMRLKALEISQSKQSELLLLTKNNLLNNDQLTANDRIRIEEDFSFKIIDLNNKTKLEIDNITKFDESTYQKSLTDKISKLNASQNEELALEQERFNALGNLEQLSQKDREKAVEEHELTIFRIKQKYAIQSAKIQIDNLESELKASDALPEKEQLTAEKRQEIAEKLTKAKLDLREAEKTNVKTTSEEEVKIELQKAAQILEISQSLTSALSDLASAIFQARIQNIENEIQKNNEYYDKQIELAGNDNRQKDFWNAEREKKNKELEEKKKKEQVKQAIFNKATQVTQIAMATSLAIITALAQTPKFDFGISAAALAAIYAGIGAIQLAAVLATPIPKYKLGRKDGPDELAIVGDGGVNEIIERKSGAIELTPKSDTLVKLFKGDKVHSSVEDYYNLNRVGILDGFNKEVLKMNSFKVMIHSVNQDQLLIELQKNTSAIKNIKQNVNIKNNIDFAHEIWKFNNTKWHT
jgi:TP901 family phage tail tape measure protein